MYSLNIRGNLLTLDSPLVMGILNVTPDSFYDGSRVTSEKGLLEAAAGMLEDGATFLDVGGYSSRPGAEDISLDEELRRTVGSIELLHKEFPRAFISVDTFRSEVASQAIDAGACMINDISGGSLDNAMFRTIARLEAPYILMHMRGTPQNMTQQANYEHLLKEMFAYFGERLRELDHLGVCDVLIDPGFGFAKNIDQNFELLSELDLFNFLERPLVVGVSRKSLIWKTLNVTPDTALNGTSALHMAALLKGANILRVHDVPQAMEVVKLYNHLKKD